MRRPSVAVDPVWGSEERPFHAMARNVSTRYLAYGVDAVIGLLMLPFNLEHLGKPMYGLWMLTASITASFALLDLGYGGALVRFIARYRALRDSKGLNEILSTLFVVYSTIGLATLVVALLLAPHLSSIFSIAPDQLATAQYVLVIISTYVALRFGFSIYGGVIVGFQRYHLNNIVSIVMSVAVAATNVAVVLAGFGLVGLVLATTAVRVLALLIYRQNAHRVYPALRLAPMTFKATRLREVSGFSVYMLLLDCGNKLNYNADTMVIGAFLGTAAVALWTPAQRLTELLTRLTNQLNDALFPLVVDSDAASRTEQLRFTLVQGTRLSLAMAIPSAGGVALLARPLINAWVGPSFAQTATVLQILAVVVVLRIANATASTILQGAGEHQRLTLYVGLTGVANLLLSMALVRPLGLVGVALGTVVPIGVMAVVASFPRACRRVGLPVRRVLMEAVWPPLWPAIAVLACLHLAAPFGGTHLIALGAKLFAAGALYTLIFFGVAISRDERRLYVDKARELMPRSAPLFAMAHAVSARGRS